MRKNHDRYRQRRHERYPVLTSRLTSQDLASMQHLNAFVEVILFQTHNLHSDLAIVKSKALRQHTVVIQL